jgi:3,4-dihydroxy 2-butanone 4-phosphate synthase/GTP cyclohydrolase II
MKLARWLAIPNDDGTRKRRRDFAARIGVTPSMITAYCEDRMWPGKERMEAIVRETGGEVTPNDFIGLSEPEPQPEVASS